MTSADFLQFTPVSPRALSLWVVYPSLLSATPARPPLLRAITFTSYICHIYTIGFGQYWTSLCLASSSVLQMPYMWFLFVRPRFCIRLPSDSTSRWTPLPSANSSYCQACSGLSPPSYRPCRAIEQKTATGRYQEPSFCRKI